MIRSEIIYASKPKGLKQFICYCSLMSLKSNLGLTCQMGLTRNVLYRLLFPREVIATIVEHTNGYAAWKMVEEQQVNDRWIDTTEAEMRAFLGINILMGISQLPGSDMFLSANNLIGNVGIQNILTCNRYHKIMQYFHVSDRSAEWRHGYDRLYKVRTVMDVVSETFLKYYTLTQQASVDEAMIAYTGRLSFR